MARKTYTEEYKKHLVKLVQAGRSPEQLAKEYEPSARTIRLWLQAEEKQNLANESQKDQELKKLRLEVARLREERDILKKAAAWFAAESVSTHKKSTGS